MKTTRRWQGLFATGLALGLSSLTGCQTWIAGMTLPSPHYLEHPPQYFVPSPAFPLTRELASMEATAAATAPGAAPVQLPAPVVTPPMPGPAPAPAAPAGQLPPPMAPNR
jgi:hypothetical protein